VSTTVDTPGRTWWRSRWVQGAASLAVVALIFGFFFPKVADYGEVRRTIEAMTPLEIATLVAVALWNLASYWPMITAVQPGLRLRHAAVANLASTSVANTLPGGGALGIGATMAMQRSWGRPVGETTLAMVVSGVWNNFVKLGLPVLALALLALHGEAGAGLASAAAVGVAVLVVALVGFGLLLHSPRTAAAVGRRAGRAVSALRRVVRRPAVEGWDRRAVDFRAGVVTLVSRRWLHITATAVVSHVSLFAVLLLALRHVGVSDAEVSWQLVLASFSFVRLMSAIPITPGGLGVVELGLTAMLSRGVDAATTNQIVAAVLLYRALTWLLPLGALAWVGWRAGGRRRSAVATPADAVVAATT
jgi:putative heme transporter